MTGSPGTTLRRLLALDDPCLICEARAEGDLVLDVPIHFPVPDLRVERSDDGTRLWLGGPGTRAELLVGTIGGRLDLRDAGGGAHLSVRGTGRVRVVMVGADDEVDRERTLRALARKGFEGLLAQRSRHASQLEALALRMRSPDRALDSALAELAQRSDAELRAVGDGHLGFDAPLQVGSALLTFGLREAVREALRAPLVAAPLLQLFAMYASWAGADDFVQKHWPRAERGALALEGPGALRSAAALVPVAEALGAGLAVTALSMKAGDSESAEFEVPAAIGERWGLRPEGLEGALDVAPSLPTGWPEMTLERIRVGASTLDLKVRRRPAGLAIKCRTTHGPAVVVHLRPRLEFEPTAVLVQDEQVPGPAVTLVVGEEVEALWLT